MAPIVTTGGYSVKNMLTHVILALWAMLIFSASFMKKNSNCACHSCAGTKLIFSVPTKKRIKRVILVPGAMLNFSASEAPRIVRVYLAQGECKKKLSNQ